VSGIKSDRRGVVDSNGNIIFSHITPRNDYVRVPVAERVGKSFQWERSFLVFLHLSSIIIRENIYIKHNQDVFLAADDNPFEILLGDDNTPVLVGFRSKNLRQQIRPAFRLLEDARIVLVALHALLSRGASLPTVCRFRSMTDSERCGIKVS